MSYERVACTNFTWGHIPGNLASSTRTEVPGQEVRTMVSIQIRYGKDSPCVGSYEMQCFEVVTLILLLRRSFRIEDDVLSQFCVFSGEQKWDLNTPLQMGQAPDGTRRRVVNKAM